MTVKVAHLFGNEESWRGYASTFSNLNCADIIQRHQNPDNPYGHITAFILETQRILQLLVY